MGSEESAEQSRGSMDKNRITRPTRPDERANDREVQRQRAATLGRFNERRRAVARAQQAALPVIDSSTPSAERDFSRDSSVQSPRK
jgi:hypothetical protein